MDNTNLIGISKNSAIIYYFFCMVTGTYAKASQLECAYKSSGVLLKYKTKGEGGGRERRWAWLGWGENADNVIEQQFKILLFKKLIK